MGLQTSPSAQRAQRLEPTLLFSEPWKDLHFLLNQKAKTEYHPAWLTFSSYQCRCEGAFHALFL